MSKEAAAVEVKEGQDFELKTPYTPGKLHDDFPNLPLRGGSSITRRGSTIKLDSSIRNLIFKSVRPEENGIIVCYEDTTDTETTLIPITYVSAAFEDKDKNSITITFSIDRNTIPEEYKKFSFFPSFRATKFDDQTLENQELKQRKLISNQKILEAEDGWYVVTAQHLDLHDDSQDPLLEVKCESCGSPAPSSRSTPDDLSPAIVQRGGPSSPQSSEGSSPRFFGPVSTLRTFSTLEPEESPRDSESDTLSLSPQSPKSSPHSPQSSAGSTPIASTHHAR